MRLPRGVTLIECLIVISIIGLLVALSLPALQAAREASRKTHCTSNMRQLGIALADYHTKFRVLPPTMIWTPSGEPLSQNRVPPGVLDRISLGVSSTDPDRARANWAVMLLPFIEEQSLHARIDMTVSMDDARNASARSTEIPLFKCPTDFSSATDNHFERRPGEILADGGYARLNYAMNAGTNKSCLMRFSADGRPIGKCTDGFQINGTNLDANTREVWGSGIGGLNKSFSFRQFPAGIDHMVAIDEIRAGLSPLDRRGVWSMGFTGSSVTAGHGIYGKASGPNNNNTDSDEISGCSALQEQFTAGGLAAMGMPCRAKSTSTYELNVRAGARSLHSGGVNLLTLGGAVRFVANEIDPAIWHNIHRRDRAVGQELPPE